MPKRTRPRRGSLQFWPRKRAKRIYSSLKSDIGFAAFKAGMTHVEITDNNSKSSTYGKVIVKPVTILDAPSLFVLGIRYYKKTTSGLKAVSEKWTDNIPKDLEIKRKTLPGKGKDTEDFDESRLIVATQPSKSGMHKKKPDIFEMNFEGDVKTKSDLLGKEISAADVFKPGEFIDVSGVTKGFGFTGPVVRYGIRIQTRKDEQHHRHVGSIGPVVPRKVSWRVPAAGQYGYFNRTETSKRVLAIDTDGSKVNADGGLIGYGLVNNYIIIEGSIPGARKRLIMLKKSHRPKNAIPVDIKSISTTSKQGA